MGARMSEPNLLRIDDLLLRGAGTSALAVVALGAFALLLPNEIRGSNLALASFLALSALAPIGMLVTGLALRRRERRALALLSLIERHVEIDARDLLSSSDFTAATLDRAVRDLNSSGARHIVWDRRDGRIQDGRLRDSRIHIETCSSCGSKTSLEVALTEAASARCPACDAPVDAREIDEERQALVAELAARAPAPRRALHDEHTFSPVLFVFLIAFCWPLGLIYAVKHWHDGGAFGRPER